jgi:CheY-like chemotaxis protein
MARHSKADQAQVELRELHGHVSLVISDNGGGFDPTLLKSLVRDGNFGLLGLRERVDASGGEIRIDTGLTGGTRIEVSLPYRPRPFSERYSSDLEVEVEVEVDKIVPTRGRAGQAKPSVLVVDDAAQIRSVLIALLADHGFDIAGEAANGAEAVELANRLRPDLVLMDVRMPLMNGREAARLIRSQQPHTQIVLLSGDGDGDAACREIGVFGSVAKGGDASLICKTLDNAWRLSCERGGRAA